MTKYDTNMLLYVNSSRLGGRFEVHRFREYRVDIDLETDTDSFDFVLKNPNGCYTSLFSKFDTVDIYLNGKPIMKGMVDIVEYEWDDNDSYIHVSGRDIAAPLVDNDALPCTRQNIKPSSYIQEKCMEYGIPNVKLDQSIPVVNKLIIGTGETEISIMNNLLLESRKRMWLIYDTMYTGEWSTDKQPSYKFTRGVPIENMGIPIKSFKLKEDGTKTISEMIIYGSTDSGENKVIGKAKNDYMVKKGIKRRNVKRSYNNDAASKYASNALRDVRDGFRDNTSIELKIKTGNEIILPNTTAQVIDVITKTNSVFFIKSVSYTKNLNSGSITTICMVLGDKTFDILWSGQGTKANGGITGTPKMTINDVVNTLK